MTWVGGGHKMVEMLMTSYWNGPLRVHFNSLIYSHNQWYFIDDSKFSARARPCPIQNFGPGPGLARFKIFSPSPARPDSKFWAGPGPTRFKIFSLSPARPDSKFWTLPWPGLIQNFRPRPGPFWFKYVGPIWNLQLKSVLLEINFEHRLKVYSKIILSSGYLNVVRFFGRRRRGRLILSLHL